MSTVPIPSAEQGTTRVFSLSMTGLEAQALSDDLSQQAAMLGMDSLNPAGIEVFALADLGELGLMGYLRDGVDAPEADLRRDRAKLAALDGWVMLVHSLALPDAGATLTPDKRLTLIGTYGQTPPDKAPIALEAEAALPYSGSATATMLPTRPRGSGSAVVVAGLVVLVVLILWALLN